MGLNTTGHLYGITPGTVIADKVVITDKSNKIDTLDVTTPKIGGTAITSTAAELNVLDGVPAGAGSGNIVIAEEVTFTEDGDTTYTGSVSVPAGAYLLDVIVHNDSLWDDGTSASMIVGDVADPNGFFDAVDLKATDLLAAEQISFGYTGGQEGADVDGGESAGDHLRRRFLATARVITGVITTGAQDGSAGVTRMLVVYVIPSTSVATGV